MKRASLLFWIQLGQLSALCAAQEAKVYHEEPLSWSVTSVRISWEFDQKTDPAAVRQFNEKAELTLATVDGYRGSFEAGDLPVSLESDNPFREMGLCGVQQQQGLKRRGDFCLTPFQESTLRTCRKAFEEIKEKGADIRFLISLKVTVYNQTQAAIVLDGSAELPVTFEDVPPVLMKPERPLNGLTIPGGGTRSADLAFSAEMSSEPMLIVLATLKYGAALDLLRARMRILQEGRDVRPDLLVSERQTYAFVIANGGDGLISWKVRKRSGVRGAELTFREILESVNTAGWKSDSGRPLFTIKDGRCVGVGDSEAVGKEYLLLASHGQHRRFFLWDWPLDAPIKGNVVIGLRHPISRTFGNMMEGRAFEGLLRYEAATHDALAQIMLGECCRRRRGVPKENPEGAAWFIKAAAQGSAAAMFNLYECYKNGWGVEKSERESMAWLRKAAERGESAAQYSLGYWYDMRGDNQESLKWYRKGAEHGERRCQYKLGRYYAKGIGMSSDEHEAVKWYMKSAEKGDAFAMGLLSLCYFDGKGVEKNQEEAVKWSRAAVAGGDAVGFNQFGYFCQLGLGVDKDDRAAVKWIRLAAENGNHAGMNNLGYFYRNGIGVEKNGSEAVKWLRLAIEHGYTGSYKTLGLCYLEGFGVEKDKAEGARLLKKAVELGETSAQDELNKLNQ